MLTFLYKDKIAGQMALVNLMNAISTNVNVQYLILDRILKTKFDKHRSYLNLERPYASDFKVCTASIGHYSQYDLGTISTTAAHRNRAMA